jgi:uncharacterized surface protein with fasciclin (FAS1) repeats
MLKTVRYLCAALFAFGMMGLAAAQADVVSELTVEEGSIVDFVTEDPEGDCVTILNDLLDDEEGAAAEDAEAVDADTLETGIEGFVCLREFLQATGLTQTFTDDPNVTLLAPTDEAFAEYARIGELNAADLLADTATLREILMYHIVLDGQSLEDFVSGGEVAEDEGAFQTALGPEVEFVSEVAGGGAAEDTEQVMVGAAVVGEGLAEAGVRAGVAGNTFAFAEGYMIPIDTVLLPPADSAGEDAADDAGEDDGVDAEGDAGE